MASVVATYEGVLSSTCWVFNFLTDLAHVLLSQAIILSWKIKSGFIICQVTLRHLQANLRFLGCFFARWVLPLRVRAILGWATAFLFVSHSWCPIWHASTPLLFVSHSWCPIWPASTPLILTRKTEFVTYPQGAIIFLLEVLEVGHVFMISRVQLLHLFYAIVVYDFNLYHIVEDKAVSLLNLALLWWS